MKAIRLFPFFAIFSVIFLTSCEEEVDFSGEGGKTAVIYGLLDQNDTLHYVKITRAFGGSNNSVEVAQISDSSYFPVVTATVTEAGIPNPRTWVLRDTILTGKDPGAFYGPEQKVYYFEGELNPAATYKLDVNVNNGEFHVYGETTLLSGFAISGPAGNSAYTFANSLGEYRSTRVSFNKGTADVVDARIEVFFDEYFDGVPQQKSFMWKLGEMTGTEIPSSNPGFNASGAVFYDLLKQNVTNNPAINKRVFAKMRIHLTGGSSDLARYILVNQPSTSLAQSKPTFTNLSATNEANAIGIFSARQTVVQERLKFNPFNNNIRAIDISSMRFLAEGPVTGGLLFCSDNPNDFAQSFACD